MKRPVLSALLISVALSAVGMVVALLSVGGPRALLRVRELDPLYLLLALLALLFAFVFSAVRLQFICGLLGFGVKLRHTIRAHVLGMFSAAVTPGGSGSMPGLALTLGLQGMKQAKAWAAAIATLSADTTFHAWALPLSLIGLYSMGAYPRTPLWTTLGIVTIVLTVAMAYVLLFRVAWLNSLVGMVMRGPLLRFRRAATRFTESFVTNSQTLSSAPLWKHGVIQVLTALSWASYFMVLYFLLLGLGVPINLWLALAGQTVVSVMSSFVPTPGASGFFEVVLSWFLVGRGSGDAGPAAVFVWRLITFYSLFVLGPLLGGFMIVRQTAGKAAPVQPEAFDDEDESPT